MVQVQSGSLGTKNPHKRATMQKQAHHGVGAITSENVTTETSRISHNTIKA
jgi:hypothetical protein